MKTYFTTAAALATLTLAKKHYEMKAQTDHSTWPNGIRAQIVDETSEDSTEAGSDRMTKARRKEINELFWPSDCTIDNLPEPWDCGNPTCPDFYSDDGALYESALFEILDSKAYGYNFWNRDNDDCLEPCEVYTFLECFSFHL